MLETLLMRHAIEQASWERVRDHLDSRLAPNFNPFDIFRSDELAYSKVIAWLLDPRETHGQGLLFQKLFWSHPRLVGARVSPSTFERVGVEQLTDRIDRDQRRIDITLRYSGVSVAIENKPFSSFGDFQIAHYLNQVKHESAGVSRYFLVVILGWEAPLPEDQLLAAYKQGHKPDQILVISYRELIDVLDQFAERSGAEPVRSYVRFFSDHLRTRIMKLRRTAGTMSFQAITADSALCRSGLQLVRERQAFLASVAANLQEAIVREFAKHGWHPETAVDDDDVKALSLRPDVRTSSILFDLGRPEIPFRFAIGFDGQELTDPFFGFRNGSQSQNALCDALRGHLSAKGWPGKKTYARWPWWDQFSSQDFQENSPAGWLDEVIATPVEFAKAAARKAELLHDALRDWPSAGLKAQPDTIISAGR